jgi:undecaprenyl-diphosphatase
MTKHRSTPLTGFLRARISPEGYLGLHLTIGTILLVAAVLLFTDLAEDVMEAGDITLVDARLAQWFHLRATPAVTNAMMAITNLHGTVGILILAALFGIYLFWKKKGYWLIALLLCVPGGLILNVLLKHAFQRARPSFDNPLVSLTTFSFPSGHTAGSTVLYGFIAAYLISHLQSSGQRVLVACAAFLLVALVGLTRIYLGAHYLSDVLAAMVEGVAWLALCITAVSTYRRRREANGGSLAMPRQSLD